ncbi:SgcJ/EcaC family oxidoreductase [Actinoplanes sp. NPDC051851]|uniref:SgcJ/EcaC family oxidoreductase n=1 Tax=Actinoplanes sp. NPDC051851 TaxID=3154753 RepID=UPI00341DE4E6
MIEDIAAIPVRMTEAWNRGDAAGFAAGFGPDSSLVEFNGEVLTGRDAIVAAQQSMFDTVLKGTRLVDGRVVSAQLVTPEIGLVRYRVRLLMPGETTAPAVRESMQLLVVGLREGGWQILTLQNARVLSFTDAARLETA